MLTSTKTQDRYAEAKQAEGEAQARYTNAVMAPRYYVEWGVITEDEYERDAKRIARETGLTDATKALRKTEDAILAELMHNAKRYGLPTEAAETLGSHSDSTYRAYRARMLQIALAY